MASRLLWMAALITTAVSFPSQPSVDPHLISPHMSPPRAVAAKSPPLFENPPAWYQLPTTQLRPLFPTPLLPNLPTLDPQAGVTPPQPLFPRPKSPGELTADQIVQAAQQWAAKAQSAIDNWFGSSQNQPAAEDPTEDQIIVGGDHEPHDLSGGALRPLTNIERYLPLLRRRAQQWSTTVEPSVTAIAPLLPKTPSIGFRVKTERTLMTTTAATRRRRPKCCDLGDVATAEEWEDLEEMETTPKPKERWEEESQTGDRQPTSNRRPDERRRPNPLTEKIPLPHSGPQPNDRQIAETRPLSEESTESRLLPEHPNLPNRPMSSLRRRVDSPAGRRPTTTARSPFSFARITPTTRLPPKIDPIDSTRRPEFPRRWTRFTLTPRRIPLPEFHKLRPTTAEPTEDPAEETTEFPTLRTEEPKTTRRRPPAATTPRSRRPNAQLKEIDTRPWTHREKLLGFPEEGTVVLSKAPLQFAVLWLVEQLRNKAHASNELIEAVKEALSRFGASLLRPADAVVEVMESGAVEDIRKGWDDIRKSDWLEQTLSAMRAEVLSADPTVAAADSQDAELKLEELYREARKATELLHESGTGRRRQLFRDDPKNPFEAAMFDDGAAERRDHGDLVGFGANIYAFRRH